MIGAAKNGHTATCEAILNCLPDDVQRLAAINHQDNNGDTTLTLAAWWGCTAGYEAILNLLPDEAQRLAAINHQNNHGQTAIELAFENGLPETVELLQRYGAVLPQRLRVAGNQVNDRQSTHTASVHESVSSSVIKLAVRYLGLPKRDKAILTEWTKSNESFSDEAKKLAGLKVMNKSSTQNALRALVEKISPQVKQWAEGLAEDSHKPAKAKLAIKRIFTSNYVDARSKVALPQALVLTWAALNDKAFIENDEHGKNKIETLIQHLFESQREYNLNSSGNDKNLNAADVHACPGGTFNKVVSAGHGLHPDVYIIQVNKNIIKAKVDALIAEHFKVDLFSQDELEVLYQNFHENVTMAFSTEAQTKLCNIVTPPINDEYRSFEEMRLIRPGTIEDAISSALKLGGVKSGPKVQDALEQWKQNQNKAGSGKDAMDVEEPVAGTAIAHQFLGKRKVAESAGCSGQTPKKRKK